MQLLPQDEKFFELLLDQARIVFDASTVLTDSLAKRTPPGDFHETAQKIRELERQGDEAVRKIYRRLHKTFITPIDPEDVHQLATLIDEILDHLEAVAYRFEAYRLERFPEPMVEVAVMVHGCVKATLEAIEALQQEGVKRPDELTRRCEEINRRELETETRVREVVRELFAAERDPISLIKQKELYELLESTADCCENVADVLDAIAVKNS